MNDHPIQSLLDIRFTSEPITEPGIYVAHAALDADKVLGDVYGAAGKLDPERKRAAAEALRAHNPHLGAVIAAGTPIVIPALPGLWPEVAMGATRGPELPEAPFWDPAQTRVKLGGHLTGANGCVTYLVRVVKKGRIRTVDNQTGSQVIVRYEGNRSVSVTIGVQVGSELMAKYCVYIAEVGLTQRFQLEQVHVQWITWCPGRAPDVVDYPPYEPPREVELSAVPYTRLGEPVRCFWRLTSSDAMAYARQLAAQHGIPEGAHEVPE